MSERSLQKPPAWVSWIVLVLISVAMLGNYYIYDCISPVADLLISQLHFSQVNVGLLNAIYSIPNIVLVLFGGVLIDRIGTKKSTMLFTVLIAMGAILTCISGQLVIMALGRLLFGIGAESMIIAITTIVARWFKGKQLAFAFGMNLTIARMGSFLAQNSPSWAASSYAKGWQSPLMIAAIFGLIAVVCIALFYLIDYISERRYNLAKEGSQEKVVLKKLFVFPNL